MTLAPLILVCAIVLASACGGSHQELGTGSSSVPTKAQAARPKPPPPRLDLRFLEALRARVDGFSRAPNDPARDHLVAVLRAMADALELTSEDARSGAKEVRSAADELEGSERASTTHTAITKRALRVMFTNLVSFTPPDAQVVQYQSILADFEAALEQLDVSAPLPGQAPHVIAAVRAAVDAMFVLVAKPPPYREIPQQATTAATGGLDGIEARVAAARESVQRLALAVDRDGAALAAADAMMRFADVLAVAKDADEQSRARRIAQVRLQAHRLRYSETSPFQRAHWAKLGLSMTLDGLDALERQPSAQLAPWRETARKAVDAIDDHGVITFQRAALQDAFRSVSDVMLAMGLVAGPKS